MISIKISDLNFDFVIKFLDSGSRFGSNDDSSIKYKCEN